MAAISKVVVLLFLLPCQLIHRPEMVQCAAINLPIKNGTMYLVLIKTSYKLRDFFCPY